MTRKRMPRMQGSPKQTLGSIVMRSEMRVSVRPLTLAQSAPL